MIEFIGFGNKEFIDILELIEVVISKGYSFRRIT
jgi:hypothetical protein